MRRLSRRRTFRIVRDLPAAGVSPSRELWRRELFDRLKEAVDALKGDCREVLYLSRIEGLFMQEIADRIGRSRNAVKKLFGRALIRFRTTMGETESLNLPYTYSLRERSVSQTAYHKLATGPVLTSSNHYEAYSQ